ncbi:MAG: SDR family oxidoreductase [Planctomycetota bacterium]
MAGKSQGKKTMDTESELVIYGASGGIGQYLVEAFREEYKIFGTYCSGSPDKLVDGAEYYSVDVTDPQNVTAFTSEIAGRLNRPVMVYTPGISPNSLLHKLKKEDWDRAMAINITGAMLASQAILPRMRDVGYGRIILVSSVLARISVPGTAAYTASKAAQCALARIIAVENAKKGITANALALGYYDVGIIRAVPEAYLNEHVIPGIPMKKLGDPANIVNAIRFVVNADYLTGATLDINGGMITG